MDMIRWSMGVVTGCKDVEGGFQEVTVYEVESAETDRQSFRAIHEAGAGSGMRALVVGDLVLLNRTSLDLELGSGGFAIVAAILENDQRSASESANLQRSSGHMMKLRYTPFQRAVLAAEEESSPHHRLFQGAGLPEGADLSGIPVMLGELHSMLPIVLCWIKGLRNNQHNRPNTPVRVAYVMSDGGALPLAISNHVRTLRTLGWLAGTVTYGHAYGGDIETVNKFTALLAARHVLQADIIVAALGPGIVGTGTPLGHTAMELGEIANAAAKLDGLPILIPRISFSDLRPRHNGLSHHVLMSLRWAAWTSVTIPIPGDLPQDQRSIIDRQITESLLDHTHRFVPVHGLSDTDIKQALSQYPSTIRTMGRDYEEDPVFFRGVCASAEFAWSCALASPHAR
jgi:hypothetical protein